MKIKISHAQYRSPSRPIRPLVGVFLIFLLLLTPVEIVFAVYTASYLTATPENPTPTSQTTIFVSNLMEVREDGPVYYINAGGERVASYTLYEGGTWRYYHNDHLSGTTLTTDEDGEVVQVLDYEPYGEQTLSTDYGTQGSPYSFTGKELDPSSGLYYYEARWYDPETGHFISTDPFPRRNPQTMIPDPARWNEYAYARGNPINYNDPTGEDGVLTTTLKLGFGIGVLDGPQPGVADVVGGLAAVGYLAYQAVKAVVAVAGAIEDMITDDAPPTVEDNSIVSDPATPEEGVNTTTIPDTGENGATITDAGNASTEEVGGGVMTSVEIIQDWVKNVGKNDPNKAPPGFEWKGNGTPESGKGNYVNPETGEKLHPDLNHPGPKGPHWGYDGPDGKFDIDPSGSILAS